MAKGDVVLLLFPLTDLSGSKLRPAVVLVESDVFVWWGFWVLCVWALASVCVRVCVFVRVWVCGCVCACVGVCFCVGASFVCLSFRVLCWFLDS